MKKSNKNRSLLWLSEQDEFSVDDKIKDAKNQVRGIYGIFVKDKEYECVYVGRALSIYDRMFGPKGHITNLMKNKHSNQQLQDAMNTKKKIKIKILKEVPFGFDNYYKDMQRLASEENKCIDQYQKINQCLKQVPEGTKLNEKQWERMKSQKIR